MTYCQLHDIVSCYHCYWIPTKFHSVLPSPRSGKKWENKYISSKISKVQIAISHAALWSVNVLSREKQQTESVLPSPMQWASIHPLAVVVLSSSLSCCSDSIVLSHMNSTATQYTNTYTLTTHINIVHGPKLLQKTSPLLKALCSLWMLNHC